MLVVLEVYLDGVYMVQYYRDITSGVWKRCGEIRLKNPILREAHRALDDVVNETDIEEWMKYSPRKTTDDYME